MMLAAPAQLLDNLGRHRDRRYKWPAGPEVLLKPSGPAERTFHFNALKIKNKH